MLRDVLIWHCVTHVVQSGRLFSEILRSRFYPLTKVEVLALHSYVRSERKGIKISLASRKDVEDTKASSSFQL